MGDEPGAVYFEHKNIVHHADFSAVNELHFSLMAQNIYLQTDAFTFIYMPGLGEELDVERFALYVSRCLRMNIASYLLSATWVYPLPLLTELTKVLIRLMIFCHNSFPLVYECLHHAPEVVIIVMTLLRCIFCIRREIGAQKTVENSIFYLQLILFYLLAMAQSIRKTDVSQWV